MESVSGPPTHCPTCRGRILHVANRSFYADIIQNDQSTNVYRVGEVVWYKNPHWERGNVMSANGLKYKLKSLDNDHVSTVSSVDIKPYRAMSDLPGSAVEHYCCLVDKSVPNHGLYLGAERFEVGDWVTCQSKQSTTILLLKAIDVDWRRRAWFVGEMYSSAGKSDFCGVLPKRSKWHLREKNVRVDMKRIVGRVYPSTVNSGGLCMRTMRTRMVKKRNK